MTVKILGTGCAKCKKLEEMVKNVMKENNISGDVEKVTQIEEIMKFGIMMTPGLVIDGKVVSSGHLPKEEQILSWLKGN